ncbi:hypothetical protein U1Q18_033223, partial [Sarracenia purpurea var. burkii]
SSDISPELRIEFPESRLELPGLLFGSSPEVLTFTPCGFPVSVSVFSTSPHSAALFVAVPTSAELFAAAGEMVFSAATGGDGGGGGVGVGLGSLRAIHEVIWSALSLPVLGGNLVSSSAGAGDGGSSQVFQVGCEAVVGLVGLELKVDGLNTSSEP